MKRLALAALLLAPPAMAQEAPVETIVSNAGSLNGFWMIQPPQGGKAMHCRIEKAPSDPAIFCFERGVKSALTLHGDQLRIAFYPTMLQTESWKED